MIDLPICSQFFSGYVDAKQGLRYPKEYDAAWSEAQQKAYEFGRLFFAKHKARYNINTLDQDFIRNETLAL
jgi:hypothetical protein